MLSLILGFLAKIGIGTIATKIAAAYEAKQTAQTDQAKIAADQRIRTLEARRDVMIAEGHFPINAAIRALIAVGPALYLSRIFIIDKVFGLGATDNLSPELWNVVTYVLGFYFLVEGAATVTRIIRR